MDLGLLEKRCDPPLQRLSYKFERNNMKVKKIKIPLILKEIFSKVQTTHKLSTELKSDLFTTAQESCCAYCYWDQIIGQKQQIPTKLKISKNLSKPQF